MAVLVTAIHAFDILNKARRGCPAFAGHDESTIVLIGIRVIF